MKSMVKLKYCIIVTALTVSVPVPNYKPASVSQGTSPQVALQGGWLRAEPTDSRREGCQPELAGVRFLENKVVAVHITPDHPTMRVQLQLR